MWIFNVCCDFDDAENEVVSPLLVGQPKQGLHDIACVVRTVVIIVCYAQFVGNVHIRLVS